MANTFHISEVNPIQFRELIELDDRYNQFSIDEVGCDGLPYFQPWQTNDTTKIQVLSDFAFTVGVYDTSGKLKATITPVEVTSIIVGQSFKVYEFDVTFASLGVGYYYIDIQYNDGSVNHKYRSHTMQVAQRLSNTLLIQYKNTFNDFSVDFTTGIVFSHRIYGTLVDYTPSFDDSIYTDQEYNNYQENSVTYDQFKLLCKRSPNWHLKQLNKIINCDSKRIEGKYYEKTEGAKWEIERDTDNKPISASIDLLEVDDFFLQQIIPGDDMATGLYTVNDETEKYIDNSANITMAGIFKRNTSLEEIYIVNTALDNTIIKVGTTNGGNELGDIEVTAADPTATLTIKQPFTAPTTVYITGLTGTLMNLFVNYRVLDRAKVNINGTGGGTFRFPKGFCSYWAPLDSADLATYWDLASGLGKAGTKYENCAIRDGRNGTTNDLGAYDISPATLDGLAALLNTQVGNNNRVLTIANLPPHFFYTFNGDTTGTPVNAGNFPAQSKNDGVNRDYQISGSGSTPGVGRTNTVGSGNSFDNRPLSRIKLPFIAITD